MKIEYILFKFVIQSFVAKYHIQENNLVLRLNLFKNLEKKLDLVKNTDQPQLNKVTIFLFLSFYEQECIKHLHDLIVLILLHSCFDDKYN